MSNVPTNLIPIRFSDLPQAQTVGPNDRMVILQDGSNKTATLGQYANIPSNSSFIVVSVDQNLPNERALAVSPGLTLTDGGAGGNITITPSGALGALVAAGNGVIAKNGTSVVARVISSSSADLTVTNGDGVSGNPTIGLSGNLSSLSGLSGSGVVVETSTGVFTLRSIDGAAGEITVTNGTGAAANPTISLASSGVVAASYGDGTNVASFTVDAKGRLTAAADVPISTMVGAGSVSNGVDRKSVV